MFRNYLVNSALLDHFLSSCHMTNHFLSLKRFLLMEDGEFAHSLATQLFHQVPPSIPSVRSVICSVCVCSSCMEGLLHGCHLQPSSIPYCNLLWTPVSMATHPTHSYSALLLVVHTHLSTLMVWLSPSHLPFIDPLPPFTSCRCSGLPLTELQGTSGL